MKKLRVLFIFLIFSIALFAIERQSAKLRMSKEDNFIIVRVEKNDKITDNEKKYIFYKVKKGDTLFKIARENNISVDDLLKMNNLKSSLIIIGQKLKVGEK